MESFRRDLFNDMTEHRAILKNVQNTNYPRFSPITKTGIAFPKIYTLFLLRLYLNRVHLSAQPGNEGGKLSMA